MYIVRLFSVRVVPFYTSFDTRSHIPYLMCHIHKGLEVTTTNNKSSKNRTILGGYYTIILTRKHP